MPTKPKPKSCRLFSNIPHRTIFSARPGYAAVADIFDKTIANDTSVDKLAEYYDKFMPSKVSGTTLDEALEKLGAVDPDSPKTVNLYAATFEDKEAIADNIAEYNRNADEDKAIEYTDYVALLMSGVTTMIDAVSYGLIAFVAISLVVSLNYDRHNYLYLSA